MGSACEEESSNSVLSAVHDSARDPLDLRGQVEPRLGRSVADVGVLPGNDLGCPAGDGPSEPLHLDGHLANGEVTADRRHPLARAGSLLA